MLKNKITKYFIYLFFKNCKILEFALFFAQCAASSVFFLAKNLSKVDPDDSGAASVSLKVFLNLW
jgi:hypothetical protein